MSGYDLTDSEPPLVTALAEAAMDTPNAVALAWEADGQLGTITYARLFAETRQLAGRLLRLADPGDRIAVWSADGPACTLLGYAAAAAGLVVIPIRTQGRDDEIAVQLEQARATLLVCSRLLHGRPALNRAAALTADLRQPCTVIELDTWQSLPAGPDDVNDQEAHLPFLVGSGVPEPTLATANAMSQSAAMSAAATAVAGLDLRYGDTWCLAFPTRSLSNAAAAALSVLARRGALAIVAPHDATAVLRLVELSAATVLDATTGMLLEILHHPDRSTYDLSSLRLVVMTDEFPDNDLIAQVSNGLAVQVGQLRTPGSAGSRPAAEENRPKSTRS